MRYLLASLALLAACAPSASTGRPAPPEAPAPGPGLPSRVLQTGGSTEIRLNNEAAPEATRLAVEATRLWDLLTGVYTELEIPVNVLDPAQRRVGNTRVPLRRQLDGVPLSRFFDCGSGMSGHAYADTYLLTASIVTTLQPLEGKATNVYTSVSATARNPTSSSDPVACSSRGALERRIVEGIRRRLQLPEG